MTQSTREARLVEVFLDVSCPWSHGALTTIRRVLDDVAADPGLPAVEVLPRFIRLHDMRPPEGMPAPPEYRTGDLPEFLRSVGVGMDPARHTYLYNPFLAHRLLAMVRDESGTDAPDVWSLARAVWSANFVRGTAIDDPYALRAAVVDAGLDVPQRIWDRLADPDDHADRTRADRERALEVSLDGVPRFVTGGVIVPAWHPIDDVRERLRAALLSPAGGG